MVCWPGILSVYISMTRKEGGMPGIQQKACMTNYVEYRIGIRKVTWSWRDRMGRFYLTANGDSRRSPVGR